MIVINFENLDKIQGIIIRLRENENAETSKNTLIAMLEELLKTDSKESKKKNINDIRKDIIIIFKSLFRYVFFSHLFSLFLLPF